MPITPKQKKFCLEYIKDFNGTQSAIRAGYSKKTANEQSSRLLANVNISKFITSLQKKMEDKFEISREKILKEYAKIAFFDIRKIFTVDGGLLPVKNIDEDSAGAIAGIESEDLTVSDLVIGKLRKVKIWDKRAALDSICKMLGYNAAEKKEILGNLHLSDLPIEFE